MSSIQMMPMVFCASLPPCPSEYNDAERSCRRRNHRSILDGAERRKIHDTITRSIAPKKNPMSGDRKMNATVFTMPASMSETNPAFATPAPMRPPMSACDDDDGSPAHQVMMFQALAPT